MPHINLLPWREQKRKEQEKRFYLLTALAGAAAVLMVLISSNQITQLINYQQQRNAFMTTQLQAVDAQIETIKSLENEKTRLLGRMNVIQRLQASRPESVHLFEQLAHVTPEGTQLVKVSFSGGLYSIEGVAESNALISRMMRNIDRSKWLQDPELVVIDSKKKEYPGNSWFSLRFRKNITNGTNS